MEEKAARKRPELLLGAAALLAASVMLLVLAARGSLDFSQAPQAAPTTFVLTVPGASSEAPGTTQERAPASYAVGYTEAAVYVQESRAGQSSAGAGLVNINRASQEELETLPGIGPAKAQAILAWRAENGGFSDPAQLLEIPGIGEKTLITLLPFLTIG